MPDKPLNKKPDISYSEAGNPILQHKPQDRKPEIVTGNRKLVQRIEAHIERYIGVTPSQAFQEIVSEIVHIDVHWLSPTPERDYHILITSGMSQRPMTVPKEAKAFQYAELVICLPSAWKVSLEAFKDEANYWPVRLLKTLARFPHEYDTWLGQFHTVRNGALCDPYTKELRFCSAFIVPLALFDHDFMHLKLTKRVIHFHGVIPIYPEEMEFKLKHGGKALLDRLDEAGIVELLDVDRPSVV